MEKNEPPPVALQRELDNELNLQPIIGRMLVVDTSQEQLLDFFYECDFQDWHPETSREVDSHQYFTIDHLPDQISRRHARVLRLIDRHDKLGGDFPIYCASDGSVIDKTGQLIYDSPINGPEILHYVDVDIAIESIPEKEDCVLCGMEMDRGMLDYALPERDPIVRTRTPVPGYRCTACEAEYVPALVSVALLEKAMPILEAAGKHNLAGSLEVRIANLRGEAKDATAATRPVKPGHWRGLTFDQERT